MFYHLLSSKTAKRRAEKTAEAAKFDAFGPNHGGGCLCIVRTCLFRLPAGTRGICASRAPWVVGAHAWVVVSWSWTASPPPLKLKLKVTRDTGVTFKMTEKGF